MTTKQPKRHDRPSRHLSKTRFMAGRQCPLRLYNDVYHRDRATPYSDTQQAVFDRGTAIGELAQKRYSGGVLVGHAPWERAVAVAETKDLLADPFIPAIYEAAIEHQGVFVRVDVLLRNGEGWDLIEVKAATHAEKEVFRLDAAIQHWVLTGAGLTIHKAGVLVLNRGYVYPGGDYDLNELFSFGDATEFCESMHGQIGIEVGKFHQMLAAGHPPGIKVGDHCFSPYKCPYYASCTEGMQFPDDPIDHIYRLNARRRGKLQAMGVETISSIPEGFELTAIQERIRQSVVTGKPWRSADLVRTLKEPTWPLYYLDFEAWQQALPPYPGMSPFQATPFQFSVHLEQSDGSLGHYEYLHKDNKDPRQPLAEALLDVLGESGSIVVYSGYERRMINQLADHLPDLRLRLLSLNERLWDFLPAIRNHYYHPGFRGSFSIKAVLPALLPEEGWSSLEITDGREAAILYLQALETDDPEVRESTFENLSAYCRQDTLAMVKLLQTLRSVSESQ